MNFTCRLSMVLVLLPAAGLAADRDVVRLQRDVALLGEDLRLLRLSIDERTSALTTLQRQTLDRLSRLSAANESMRGSMREMLQQDVNTPMENVAARLDEAVSASVALKQSIAGLSLRLRRVEDKLEDIDDAIRILQSPPPPPPPSETRPSGEEAESEGSSGQVPRIIDRSQLNGGPPDLMSAALQARSTTAGQVRIQRIDGGREARRRSFLERICGVLDQAPPGLAGSETAAGGVAPIKPHVFGGTSRR